MALIREAASAGDLDSVRRLFLAYRDTPGVAECAAGFEKEIATLPGVYAPPAGALFLASVDGFDIGCAALRPLGEGVCEMKRLYVDPAARGAGAGRQLALAAIHTARAKRYRTLRLDTLPTMESAIALYRSIGFRQIACYYGSAPPSALFFELTLPESVL
ncbi:MAG: GNAT family N-acetyltransferase [Bryobacteraceae bacterium]|nr:GNAT family N-acetyltransferase [Bryobacteraceae bacterium]